MEYTFKAHTRHEGRLSRLYLESLVYGSSFRTDGQTSALPFFGLTDMSRAVNLVSPPVPSGMSFRYRKKVRMRWPVTVPLFESDES